METKFDPPKEEQEEKKAKTTGDVVTVAEDMEPEESVQVREVIVVGDMEPVQVRYGPWRP